MATIESQVSQSISSADEGHLVTTTLDGLAGDVFGSAIGIHLGSVDEPHPEVERKPKRRDLGRAPASIFAHPPRALTERNDRLAGWKRYHANVCRDVHADDSGQKGARAIRYNPKRVDVHSEPLIASAQNPAQEWRHRIRFLARDNVSCSRRHGAFALGRQVVFPK
jgi:hypothetical protein